MPRLAGKQTSNRSKQEQPQQTSRGQKQNAQTNPAPHRIDSRHSGDISHGPSPSELSYATATSSGSRRLDSRSAKQQTPVSTGQTSSKGGSKKGSSPKNEDFDDDKDDFGINIDEDYTNVAETGDLNATEESDEEDAEAKPTANNKRRADEKPNGRSKNGRPGRSAKKDEEKVDEYEEKLEESDDDGIKLEEVVVSGKKATNEGSRKQPAQQKVTNTNNKTANSVKSSIASRYANRPMRSTAKAVLASMTPRGFKDRVQQNKTSDKTANSVGKKSKSTVNDEQPGSEADSDEPEQISSESTASSVKQAGSKGGKKATSTSLSPRTSTRGKSVGKKAAAPDSMQKGVPGQFRQNPRRNVNSVFMPDSRSANGRAAPQKQKKQPELAGIASDEELSEQEGVEMPDEKADYEEAGDELPVTDADEQMEEVEEGDEEGDSTKMPQKV